MNIIVNACQAIATSRVSDENLVGRILITTKEQDNQVVIVFKDNGCGMDKETQLHIFEPFYTTKDIGTGTGLGMAISFGIIEEHGGIINIHTVIGEGTEITIHLPFSIV
jgi:signal transduction histidine kinase